MMLRRRAKLEAIRMEKVNGGKRKAAVFESWKRGTHFIGRRITFDRGGIGGFQGGRTAVKADHLQQWSEVKMSNYLNKKYENMGSDSYLSESAFRFNAASAFKHEGNVDRLDAAIGRFNEQFNVKR